MFLRLSCLVLLISGMAAMPTIAQGAGAISPPSSSSPSSPSSSGSSSASKPKTTVHHYQDWDVRCGSGSQGSSTQCEMTQLVSQGKSDNPIMRIAIGFPPNVNKPVAIFLLPLGMRLPQGVQLSVDGDSPRSFPVQLCVKQGCRADLPIKNSLLSKMRRGRNASVTIHDPRGQTVDLKVSLLGFSDAFKRISR